MTKTTYRATLDDLMDAAVREGVEHWDDIDTSKRIEIMALHMLDNQDMAVEYIINHPHLKEFAECLFKWMAQWPAHPDNTTNAVTACGVLNSTLADYLPETMQFEVHKKRIMVREEAREAAMDARREQNLIEGVNSYARP